MKTLNKPGKIIAVCGLMSGLAGGVSHAADVPLFNFGDPATFAVLYDDFYSFSLPILSAAVTNFTQLAYTGGGQTPSAYYFNTANTIQDALVIGTGAQTDNSDLGLTSGFVQNGYDFPNVTGNGVATFSTTDPATYPSEPGGSGTPASLDQSGTWDISLSALREYLTIDGVQYDLMAYFNNNQQGDVGTDVFADNNLWAWAEVTLQDTDGGGGTKTLYFRNPANSGAGAFTLFGHQEYVLSGGPVTLCFDWINGTNNDAGSTVVPCDGNEDWSHVFGHNLGQNEVGYGITSMELNGILRDLSSPYDVMRVRVDMGELNNGFENLFIGAANIYRRVPEPNTLALLAAGLLGAGWLGRRQSRRVRG